MATRALITPTAARKYWRSKRPKVALTRAPGKVAYPHRGRFGVNYVESQLRPSHDFPVSCTTVSWPPPR